MRRRSLLKGFLPAALASGPAVLYAEVYLTPDQAGQQLFKGEKLNPVALTLTNEQKKAVEKASGVRVRATQLSVFRASGGGWLFLDNVIGKHEFIDFAFALNKDGSVKGVEILTYRETYGGEVRNPKWRAQFSGKTSAAPLELDKDIRNISGATLSSAHITDGVKRLLHTYEIALKNAS